MLSEEKPSTSAGGSSAESSVPDDVDAQAKNLLAIGKRHLLVGDPAAAAVSLQESCRLISEKYGQLADECADVYYYYGCSLLEIGRLENTVLGNALQGAPEPVTDTDTDEDDNAQVQSTKKMEDQEKKAVVAQVREALASNYDEIEGKSDKGDTKGDGDKEGNSEKGEPNGVKDKKGNSDKGDTKADGDKGESNKGEPNGDKDKKGNADKGQEDEKMETDKEAKTAEKGTGESDKKEATTGDGDGEASGAAEGTGDEGTEEDEEDEEGEDDGEGTAEEGTAEEGEGDETADPDDMPNFQLAWEMLELARIIYCRKQDKETKLKVAQVYYKLGELGLETESYAQCLDDFVKCLTIQKEHLEPESRLIAGSHYNLGLAFLFAENFDKAIEHFKGAKSVIEMRKVKLEKQKGETKDEKEVEDIKKEIEELKELIPDITTKLDDAEDSKKQKAEQASSGFDQASTGAEIKPIQVKKSTDEPEATDISYLVKRKRKPESDTEPAIEKRSKQENKENGVATNGEANGIANGHHNGISNGITNGEAKMETA